jgi:hypothetical protein
MPAKSGTNPARVGRISEPEMPENQAHFAGVAVKPFTTLEFSSSGGQPRAQANQAAC